MQEDDDSNDPSRRASSANEGLAWTRDVKGDSRDTQFLVPLYGKFPVLYGNSMENLPNKGVPLLGVPDNPTELESQECCWSTLDLVKIHTC